MWGCGVLPTALPAPFSATLSPALWVYLCANVGPQGLLVLRLPAPFVPHSASLGPATATRVLSAPMPVCAPPTGLDECLFFISLVSDFLAIRFSVSSGCVRRRSVSNYAAILVPFCSFLRFFLFFCFGHVSLSPYFVFLSVFVSMYLVDLLCLSVLVGWPYVVSCGAKWYILSDHLGQELQQCLLCGLREPCCCR